MNNLSIIFSSPMNCHVNNQNIQGYQDGGHNTCFPLPNPLTNSSCRASHVMRGKLYANEPVIAGWTNKPLLPHRNAVAL